MAGTSRQASVRPITDPATAEHLIHPLRARLLALARDPISAAQAGKHLGESRQKVNYHLHKLLDAGLVALVDERPVRGVKEKLYQATSQAYLLAPDVLGPAAPGPSVEPDRFSVAHLLALTGRTQSELAEMLTDAEATDRKVPTLAMDTTLWLADAEQRQAFTQALREAVADVVDRFSTPTGPLGEGAPGAQPHRMIIGVHPRAGDPEAPSDL